MRRFEQQTENGTRFWEIEQVGSELHFSQGRVGTKAPPDEREESYRNANEAKREADRLIRSRLSNGFVEVVKQSLAAAREVELADADDEVWRVFGDELQTLGDPRGELISLQHAKSKAAVEKFIEKHAAELLGAIDDFSSQVKVGWRHGYFESVRLGCEDDADDRSIDELLPVVLRHESARFLRSLVLGWPELSREASYDAVIEVLTKQLWPRCLRELVVGDFTHSDVVDRGASYGEVYGNEAEDYPWPELRTLAPLLAKPDAQRLQSLTVRASLVELGAMRLPQLHTFSLAGQHLSRRLIDEVCRAELPALRRFSLDTRFSPDVHLDVVLPMLSGRLFPGLTGFGLGGFGLVAVEAVASAAQLPEWEWVDLSSNGLTDVDVPRLVALAARFRHLKKLLLRHNVFTPLGTGALKEAMPFCDLRYQRASRALDVGERYDETME